ncbi:hypothetical protein L598_000800000370 [Mesorhizobium sp. J18]|nr:hypothetical protein L598_000800000370 [Mesorhizobium sp. J18]
MAGRASRGPARRSRHRKLPARRRGETQPPVIRQARWWSAPTLPDPLSRAAPSSLSCWTSCQHPALDRCMPKARTGPHRLPRICKPSWTSDSLLLQPPRAIGNYCCNPVKDRRCQTFFQAFTPGELPKRLLHCRPARWRPLFKAKEIYRTAATPGSAKTRHLRRQFCSVGPSPTAIKHWW